MVRTPGRITLRVARRFAVDTALKVVWTAGRCQIRGAAGTCRDTSHSEQALLPTSSQQPEFLWGLLHGGVLGFKAVPTAGAQVPMSTLSLQPVSLAFEAGQSNVQLHKTVRSHRFGRIGAWLWCAVGCGTAHRRVKTSWSSSFGHGS